MIEQIYATKQEAFDAGKAVGRLDLDDHAKKRIADLEAELQRHQRGEDTGYQLTLAELTIAEKRVEALEAALRELAGDDIYNRNGSDWHDVGAMSRGVREFAKSKL